MGSVMVLVGFTFGGGRNDRALEALRDWKASFRN